MGQFDRQIKTAQKLIKKNGELVKWRVIVDPPTEPDKPWKPTEADPINKMAVICFLPISAMKTFTLTDEVPQGAVMGLMGQVDFEPNLKDVVIRDGKELRILSIDLLSPNGQKILYTVVFKE